jgi:hypothetical protein
VPYFAPGEVPTEDDLREYGGIRDALGRYVRTKDMFDPDVASEAYCRAIEAKADEKFGTPNSQGITGLGTYRSMRRAADKLREAGRAATCLNCGGPMPASARSDARTCSDACRQAYSRTRRRASKACRAPISRHGYALGLGLPVRTLDPFITALADYTDEVWVVPLPDAYPDEREWRMTQAMTLLSLVRDERTAIRPSLVRFRRRAKHYIRRMKRLSKGS